MSYPTTEGWRSALPERGTQLSASRFGLGVAPPGEDGLLFLVLLAQHSGRRCTVQRAESYAAGSGLGAFAGRAYLAYRNAASLKRAVTCRISVAGGAPPELEAALRGAFGPLARFPAVPDSGGSAAERACRAALAALGAANREVGKLAQAAGQRAQWFA